MTRIGASFRKILHTAIPVVRGIASRENEQEKTGYLHGRATLVRAVAWFRLPGASWSFKRTVLCPSGSTSAPRTLPTCCIELRNPFVRRSRNKRCRTGSEVR
jgi:hypothetical protein